MAGRSVNVGTSYGSVTNTGVLRAAGGTLQVDSGTSATEGWSSTGQIQHQGGTLNLGGLFDVASFNTLTNTSSSGVATQLNGILDIEAGTLALNATTGNLRVVSGGILRNGTVTTTGGAQLLTGTNGRFENLVLGNGTLEADVVIDAITMRNSGNLTLGAGSSVTLTNGGWLYFDSANASLLGTGSVVFGDASSTATNYLYYNNSTAGTALSIGAGVTVGGATSLQHGTIYTSSANTGIANAGTIVAGVAGRSVNVGTSYGSVVNTGTMNANTGVLVLNGATLDNSSGDILATNGGRVDLSTTVTTANLGTLNASGGIVRLVSGGVLDNTGDTFEPGVDVIGSFTVSNGTILGGIVRDDPANPAALVFEGSTIPRFSDVTLDYDLNVASGQTLYVSSGDLTLAAGRTLTLGAGGGPAYLYFIENATQRLQTVAGGSAQVRFANTTGESYVYSNLSNSTQQLVIGQGMTIGGTGDGYIYSSTLVNEGTIRAGAAGQNIRVTGYGFDNLAGGLVEAASGGSIQFTNYSASPTEFTNAGIIRAATGGTVELESGTFSGTFLSSLSSTGGIVAVGSVVDNVGQTLVLDPTTIGNLNLFSGGTIRGGTITSVGGASLTMPNAGSVTLDNVTLDTDFVAAGNSTISVPGTLTINAGHRLSLGSGINAATLVFTGSATNSLLRGGAGTAEVAFAGGTSNLYHNNGTLEIGAGVLVHSTGGSGNVNSNGRVFTNNGRIEADVAGQTIDLNATGMTNAGVIAASNGSILSVYGNLTPASLGAFDAVDGVLRLRSGAVFDLGGGVFTMSAAMGGVQLSGGTIRNGTLRDGGAAMSLGPSSGTLESVTLDQNLTVANRTLSTPTGLSIQGGRTLNLESGGTLSLTGTSVARSITRAGSGTAEIVLGSGSINAFNTGALTLGPGLLVRAGNGSGSIGTGNTTDIINQGTIEVDQAGRQVTLFLNAGGTIDNQGLIEVVQGATLSTSGHGLTNNSGAVGSGLQVGGTISLGTGVTLTNNGRLGPGSSPGLTTISGNLVLGANSVLDIEVAGLNRGTEYDAIDVSGTATLGGSVNVIRFGTYTETAGDVLRVVTAQGGLSGVFAPVSGVVAWNQQNNARNAYLQAISNDPIVVWSLNNSGAWNIAANWLEVATGATRLPTANDLVIIDQPGNLGISITTGAQAAKRLFSAESISLSGGSLTLGADSVMTALTQTGAGSVLGGTGTLTLTGASSFTGGQWTGGGSTRVASGAVLTMSGAGPGTNLGNRTLDIAAGGTANFSNEIELEGTATITNAGTLNLAALGTANAARISNIYNNNGTLTLTNTGVINQTGTGAYLIGGDLNNNGTLNVNGGTLISNGLGSATSNGVLNLAAGTNYQHAGGTQTLSAGAQVNSTASSALITSGGTLNVNAATANFNHPGIVQTTGGAATYAPNLNVAQVLLSGGTTTFNGTLTTPLLTQTGAATLSGTGLVTLTGTATFTGGQWTGGGTARVASGAVLTMSGAGPGTNLGNRTLDIAAGGTANFSNEIELEGTATITNAGTLNLAALGTANAARISNIYNNNGTLSLTNTGAINVNGSGTYLVGADIANNAGGVINGDATLDLAGRTLINSGTIRPGGAGAIGFFDLAGNFAQTGAGRLEIETEGTAPGATDAFAVSGSAVLGGILELVAINGYQPSANVTYTDVLTYGSRTGAFESVLGSGFPLLTPTYGANGLIVAGGTGGTPGACPPGFDVCWIGTASGSWNDTAQWNTGAVPTAADNVYIAAPGSITITAANGGNVNRLVSEESFLLSGGAFVLTGNSSIAEVLTITGGTLQANAALDAGSIVLNGGALALGANAIVTVANQFAWSNGSLFGNGPSSLLQITAPASLNVTGGSKVLVNVALDNAGQVNLGMNSGSTLFVNDGAAVTNSGTLTFTQSNLIGTSSGGGTVNNTGTIAVAAGQTGVVQPTTFNNAGGTLQANGGTLQLRSGTSNYNGTTTIAGTGVQFDGGTHVFADGAVIDGQFNQSTNVTFNATTIAGTWNQSGGTSSIAAGDTVTLNGTANWSNGNIVGGAGSALALTSGDTLNVTGGSKTLVNVALNNAGQVNLGMADGSSLFVNDSAGIANSGTLTFAQSNIIGTSSGGGTLANSGTVAVAAGRTGVVQPTAFTNVGGTLAADGGTLQLRSGTSSYSGVTTLTGTGVQFDGGNHTFADGARIQGQFNQAANVTFNTTTIAGTWNQSGGTSTVASGATVNLDGTANWSDGSIVGSGGSALALTAGDALNVTGGSKVLVNVALDNAGQVNLGMNSGSTLFVNDGAAVTNSGTLTFTQSNLIGTSSGGGTVNNTGTIAVAAGQTGVVQPTTFNNAGGTLQANGGTLQLRSGTSNYNGTTTIAGTGVQFDGGTHTFADGATVAGQLNQSATLSFGTVALNGVWNQLGGSTTIGANDTLTLNGTANWSDGSMVGGGGSSLALTAGDVLNVTGGSKALVNVVLGNAGQVNLGMSSGSTLFVNDGAAVTNSGTLTFTQSNIIGTSSGAGRFDNAGTLSSASGVGATVASTFFTNDGLVAAGSNSTVQLLSGGTHTGAFEAATGGAVVFAGGAHNLSDGSRLTNGLLQVAGGSVNLVGTGAGTIIPVGAVVTLSGQTLNGAGRLDNQGTLNLAGSTIAGSVVNSGSLNVTGASAINGARFDLDAGALVLAVGSTLTKNGGVFAWNGGTLGGTGTFATAGGAQFDIAGGGARVLDGQTLNTGALNLTAGSLELRSGNLTTAGISTIGSGATLVLNGGVFNTSAPVTVDGTLDLRAGTLAMNGDATHAGTFLVAGGTVLEFASGAQTLAGSIAGPGSVTVSGADLTVAATGVLNAGTFTQAAGTTTVLGNLGVANFVQSGGAIAGAGNLSVSNSYAVTGGIMGTGWNLLSITHAVGDLVLNRVHAANTATVRVTNGALRIAALGNTNGLIGRSGVTVQTSGDLVLQASVGEGGAAAFIESTGGPCSIDVGGTTRLTAIGQGANAYIRGMPDVGSSQTPYRAVGPIEFVDSNGGSARIESTLATTVYVNYPSLSSGGYTVNGVPVTSAGSSGFFAGGAPAVLGQNLFITYGLVPPPPPSSENPPIQATQTAAVDFEVKISAADTPGNAVVIPLIQPEWVPPPPPSVQSAGKGGVSTERRPISQCR
ncbi:MAG: hypothetical protein K2X67_08960 [Burkholderiales bacterium]|nr:hypothetical protein [Burkholderiales bacterium]